MPSRRGTGLGLTTLVLLAGAAAAWLETVNRMRGMDMGPGTDLGGLGWFAGVWAVMMAAMMLPSRVPMAGAYATRPGSEAGASRAVLQTTLFVGGYLVTWVLVGLASWALVDQVRSLDVSLLAWRDGGRYVAGAVIAAAGLYELTPLKARCLRRCRDRELLVADWREGSFGATRTGLAQGVVIAALIATEKLLPSAVSTCPR